MSAWSGAEREPPFGSPIISPPIGHPPVPTFRQHIMSTGGDELDGCPKFTDKYHPNRIITIVIPSPFNINNLNPTITQQGILQQAPWTTPTGPVQPVPPPTWSPRTQLDLNVDLVPTPTGNKHDKTLIKVIVEDPSVRFRTDGYAVEATGKDGNGKHMLCQLDGGYTPGSVLFLTKYFTDNNGKQPTFGSYNLGLVLGAGNTVNLPIFIDPEIENNG